MELVAIANIGSAEEYRETQYFPYARYIKSQTNQHLMVFRAERQDERQIKELKRMMAQTWPTAKQTIVKKGDSDEIIEQCRLGELRDLEEWTSLFNLDLTADYKECGAIVNVMHYVHYLLATSTGLHFTDRRTAITQYLTDAQRMYPQLRLLKHATFPIVACCDTVWGHVTMAAKILDKKGKVVYDMDITLDRFGFIFDIEITPIQ